MGCGKSAAAQTFRNLGVQVLDADKLCHEALESDACVRKAVCDILGKDCFDVETGIVRREKMWEKKARETKESGFGLGVFLPIIAVEVPLLYEKNLEKKFDVCICVYCSDKLRVKRLENRGMALEQIVSRDAFQLPSETKALKADIVLFNETDFAFLQKQAALVLSRLKKYGR